MSDMKSSEFITEDYKIRKVKRERPNGSQEIKYEVLDAKGVTRKVFDDKKAAQEWARANWDIL